MPAIYNNAICTIVASFPSSSDEGFLGNRCTYTRQAVKLQARTTCRSDDPEQPRLVVGDPQAVLAYFTNSDSSSATEPLSERGWYLEERLLSTRVLEYRRTQVRFLCPSTGSHDMSKADGWINDWPKDNGGDISFPNDPHQASLFVPATLLGWDIETIPDFKRLWYSIVEAYTRRCLTFASDRTLAISGIAQQIRGMNKTRPEDTYTAGHWFSKFPQDLLRYCTCPDWTINQRAARRRPTWAWTSIDTEVEYPERFHSYNEQAVELVRLDVKLKDDNTPFGDVDNATLVIKGRIASNAVCHIAWVEYFPRDLMLRNKTTGRSV